MLQLGSILSHSVLFRPCCRWAVSAPSLTAASTRRPTGATSWGSACTCRCPPTCSPRVRACPAWSVPVPRGLEVGLNLHCVFQGVTCRPQKQEGPCCRTSFPNAIGPLFCVFNVAEGGAGQPRAWFCVRGRPPSQPWQWEQPQWLSEGCSAILAGVSREPLCVGGVPEVC